jgi:hypothetical protein
MTTSAYDAFYENQAAGGFDPATLNLQVVGSVVVEAIVNDWNTTYSQGIAPQSAENGSYVHLHRALDCSEPCTHSQRTRRFYGDDLATLRPNGTAQARFRFRRSFVPVE